MTQGSEKTARLRGKCAAGMCVEERLPGSKFCEKHAMRETVRGPVPREKHGLDRPLAEFLEDPFEDS